MIDALKYKGNPALALLRGCSLTEYAMLRKMAGGGVPVLCKIDMANGPVDITATGYTQGGVTTDYAGSYEIMQSTPAQVADVYITVTDAVGTITLNGLNIKNPTVADGYPPGCVDVTGDATIILLGNNILQGGDDRAGTVTVHSGKTIIKGTGKLEANATTGRAAGIHVTKGSTLQIDGGTIEAKGRYSGAGIGVSGYGHAGTIIINGGTVSATGSSVNGYYHSAGIGGSKRENGNTYYDCQKVEINGGTVNAVSGNATYVDDIFAETVVDNRA